MKRRTFLKLLGAGAIGAAAVKYLEPLEILAPPPSIQLTLSTLERAFSLLNSSKLLMLGPQILIVPPELEDMARRLLSLPSNVEIRISNELKDQDEG